MLSLLIAMQAAVAAEGPSAEQALAAARMRTSATADCRNAKDADAIIVCGTRVQPYRLPLPVIPAEGSRSADLADAAGERTRLAGKSTGAGGIGSCSTVGAGGSTGCTSGLSVLTPLFWLLQQAAGQTEE